MENITCDMIEMIRERWAKATPGPWRKSDKYGSHIIGEDNVCIGWLPSAEKNVEAILNAPSDIAYLLYANEEKEKENNSNIIKTDTMYLNYESEHRKVDAQYREIEKLKQEIESCNEDEDFKIILKIAKEIVFLQTKPKSSTIIMHDKVKLNNRLERLYLDLHNAATPEVIIKLFTKLQRRENNE